MNIIDHRILIPTPPTQVWQVISDISRNPEWQVDCRAVSFLTTSHDGPGVRWRSTSSKGRDFVLETSAWYDGLGYEYRIIDGVNFKDNKGLIRLQEIAEGTIVQWTFSYAPSGFLGGRRNRMGSNRQIENAIIESLRLLWRKQARNEEDYEAKSLMRDAPDAQARSAYKPRHPSTHSDEQAAVAQEMANGFPIKEPPITEDDTRPRPAVAAAPPAPTPAPEPELKPEPKTVEPEPDFLQREPDAPFRRPAETKPAETNPAETNAAETKSAEPVASASTPTDETVKDTPVSDTVRDTQETEAQPVEETKTTPSEAPPVAAQDAAPTESTTESVSETQDKTDAVMDEVPVTEPHPPVLDPAQPDKTDKTESDEDTSRISVFDIFGLQKPSETQEMRAVKVDNESPGATQTTEIEVTAAASPAENAPAGGVPSRTGLRITLRRKSVRLRRP